MEWLINETQVRNKKGRGNRQREEVERETHEDINYKIKQEINKQKTQTLTQTSHVDKLMWKQGGSAQACDSWPIRAAFSDGSPKRDKNLKDMTNSDFWIWKHVNIF